MEIIKNILDLNKAISNIKNLGYVPTMGGLHNGHLSLIKKSKKVCKKTIVSIFVNPTQFNNNRDYKKYPRNLNRDISFLKKLKIDFLFIPKENDIYKNKRNKKIKLNNNEKILCAIYRKGHFEGVLDVMDRLLNLIHAKYVFMGKKDYQQIFLIKKFIKNKYKSNIIECNTVRDKNKIAMSSRNFLLNKKNYFKASLLAKYFLNFRNLNKKQHKNNNILNKIKIKIEKKFNIKIEYLEFRNVSDLKIANFKEKYKLFIAYSIGGIRLIDNY